MSFGKILKKIASPWFPSPLFFWGYWRKRYSCSRHTNRICRKKFSETTFLETDFFVISEGNKHLTAKIATGRRSILPATRERSQYMDTIKNAAVYMSQDTRITQYLPYPQYLLTLDISGTAKVLYALLLNRATLSQRNA